MNHTTVQRDCNQKNRTDGQTTLTTVEQRGLVNGSTASRGKARSQLGILVRRLIESGLILWKAPRTGGGTRYEDQRIDNEPVRRKTIVWKIYLVWTYVNHLIMTNKRESVLKRTHRAFDGSHLVRRSGIEPQSRRQTEGARVSDSDKPDVKTGMTNETKAYQLFVGLQQQNGRGGETDRSLLWKSREIM